MKAESVLIKNKDILGHGQAQKIDKPVTTLKSLNQVTITQAKTGLHPKFFQDFQSIAKPIKFLPNQ